MLIGVTDCSSQGLFIFTYQRLLPTLDENLLKEKMIAQILVDCSCGYSDKVEHRSEPGSAFPMQPGGTTTQAAAFGRAIA